MLPLLVLLIGFILGLILAYPDRADKALFYEKILLSLSFFCIGIQGILFGFIPHIFFADAVARGIGWPTGSPFQFEVGAHDGSWGVLGVLSLWFKGGFLLATCIGWSLFLILAALGHLRDTLINHNYAPFNYPFIAGDFIPALFLLVFAYLYYKNSKKPIK